MGTQKNKIQHFISEPIEVAFLTPPNYSKKPSCPNQFIHGGEVFLIVECLTEWQDFTRRGRMARNMQTQHAQAASKHGSWGVGRFYFDVTTENGRLFRLYYDRSPKDALDRSGEWTLLAELSTDDD
ncbi:MAG: DUF6504 family protein [Brevefilum sp.]|nr:DUF6504 family protein [Brevefilum sp.]MDT8382551.1 DUF6504 family protein [Brevefilum sp.]MDW7755168.1 DUF6504 family protein [Brevefilum sp.]